MNAVFDHALFSLWGSIFFRKALWKILYPEEFYAQKIEVCGKTYLLFLSLDLLQYIFTQHPSI